MSEVTAREVRLNLRITKKQESMLADLAAHYGLTMSDGIRACVGACMGQGFLDEGLDDWKVFLATDDLLEPP